MRIPSFKPPTDCHTGPKNHVRSEPSFVDSASNRSRPVGCLNAQACAYAFIASANFFGPTVCSSVDIAAAVFM